MKRDILDIKIGICFLEVILASVLIIYCYFGFKSENIQVNASLAKKYANGNKEALVDFKKKNTTSDVMLLSNDKLIESDEIIVTNPNDEDMKVDYKIYIPKELNIDLNKLTITLNDGTIVDDTIETTNNYIVVSINNITLNGGSTKNYDLSFYYFENIDNFNYLFQVESK